MFIFRYLSPLIFFILLSCESQKKEPIYNSNQKKNSTNDTRQIIRKSIFSKSSDRELIITNQGESLYQKRMAITGFIIDVYQNGLDSPTRTAVPHTFLELVSQLKKKWALPSDSFSHPVMEFLIALHKQEHLRFKEGAIQRRNIKSLLLALSFLSGELKTQTLLDTLRRYLGGEFSSYVNDPNVTVTWSNRGKNLVLTTQNTQKSIPVVHVENQHLYDNQLVKPVTMTFEQQTLMDREYRGRIGLMDNAYGKIKEIFIFYNEYHPYKTVLAISRLINADITIITRPQSHLLHFVEHCIKSLEQGYVDKENITRFLTQQVYGSGKYKNHIEILCRESLAKPVVNNRGVFLTKWKNLRKKIFLETTHDHEQNLKKRLHIDGIDRQRIRVITSEYLESQWARDYFLVGSDKRGKPYFLETSLPLDIRNKTLAKELALHPVFKSKWKILDTRLPFEGGDMKAVGQWLFVGENTFGHSLEFIKRALKKQGSLAIGTSVFTEKDTHTLGPLLCNEYEGLFGRDFVLVGVGDASLQALFHIDMFLTFLPNPGEKPTVVIADMKEAVSLLGNLSEEEMVQIERSILQVSLTPDELSESSPFWLYRGLFMRHDLMQILIHGGLPRYISIYKNSPKSTELQKRLDAIATWFIDRGYPVQRAPTAVPSLGYINYWSQKNGIAILQTLKDNAQRVYNNALVEMYGDRNNTLHRIIYIPQYGISPIERRLVEIYNSLGYRVVFIPYMWESAFEKGGLNCLTTEVRQGIGD